MYSDVRVKPLTSFCACKRAHSQTRGEDPFFFPASFIHGTGQTLRWTPELQQLHLVASWISEIHLVLLSPLSF